MATNYGAKDSRYSPPSDSVVVRYTEDEHGVIQQITEVLAPNFEEYAKKEDVRKVIGDSDDRRGTLTVQGAYSTIRDVDAKIGKSIDGLDSTVQDGEYGIDVAVVERDGKLYSLVVRNGLVGREGDSPEANTIYGAKAAAAAILGSSSDDPSKPTLYGAIAHINEVDACLHNISSISCEEIDSLFCD